MDQEQFQKVIDLMKEYGLLPDCDNPLEEYTEESLNHLKEFVQKIKEL